MEAKLREVKHLSTLGKESKSDFLSSGERKGNSLNLVNLISCERWSIGVIGFIIIKTQLNWQVRKIYLN